MTPEAIAMTEKNPKKKPNPKPREKRANGIAIPAAMKWPTAPTVKRERFGIPRGRGGGGVGTIQPGPIGGPGYIAPGGGYGIPPEGCIPRRERAAAYSILRRRDGPGERNAAARPVFSLERHRLVDPR